MNRKVEHHMRGAIALVGFVLVPLMSRGNHPGMQRET